MSTNLNKDGFVGGSLLTHKQLTEMKLRKRNEKATSEVIKPSKAKKSK